MNTNEPDLAVSEIFRESDSYYLIGFRPADLNANGKFHEIAVKTTRRGLDVRARSGYTAPTGAQRAAAGSANSTESEPVRVALTGLLPASDTLVDVNAATFAVPDTGRATIVLTAGVGAFAPELSGAALAIQGAPFEIVVSAFDRSGRPKGIARQTVELSWPATASATPDRRLDVLSRLDLAPGDYEVRVAVSRGTRTASVFSYVTIPPFATAPLSLSNIITGAPAGTLTAPKDFLSPLFPIVPTARREFARAEPLVAFFRVYQGTMRREPLVPVQLRSSIVDAHDKIVASEASVLDVAQFAKGRTADHYVTLPLTTLAPGEYLLKVETTMGARTAGRAMRFIVK
jgi:hypothetical protein